MKILQFGKAYPPVNLGGVEVVIQLLAEGLNRKNISCDVLGVNDKFKYNEHEGKFGGRIFRTKLIKKAFSTLLSLQLIAKLIQIKNNYDIIHIHSPDPMATLALFIARPKCKIVLHWHCDILKQKFLLFFFNPLLVWMLKRSDLILATSPNYVEGSTLLQRFIKKVEILPIGIDIDQTHYNKQLYDETRAKYDGKKIIFSLGRLVYYKGYEYLIEAAKNLPNNYVIIIAGDGNERIKLEELIIENKLGEKVKLIGKVSEEMKNVWYAICDIFVLSSIYKTEAYAIVQVEALAFGKPIVSTQIPGSGVDWVNQNQLTGFTVPIKNSQQLADNIIKLLNVPDLYNTFSKNAEKRYNSMFTQDKMIDDVLKYYHNL